MLRSEKVIRNKKRRDNRLIRDKKKLTMIGNQVQT